MSTGAPQCGHFPHPVGAGQRFSGRGGWGRGWAHPYRRDNIVSPGVGARGGGGGAQR